MTKFTISMVLIMLLIGGTVTAVSGDQNLIINLEPSDPGDTLQVGYINWPACFDEQIDLVNDGQGEFYVEVYNDPTIWQLVNWLKKQPGKAVLDTSQMNLTLDGGLNLARM